MSGNQFALEDHYKTLGVSKSASDKEIKEAFYKLAKKYHPDSNKDNQESLKKFQEISNAYECLTSKEKKENPERQDPENQHGTRTSQRNVRVRTDFSGDEFGQEDINIKSNNTHHYDFEKPISEQHQKRSKIRQNRQQHYSEVFRDLDQLYKSLGRLSESFQVVDRKKQKFGLPNVYVIFISLFLIGSWVMIDVEKQNYEICKNLDSNDEKNNDSKYQTTSYMSSYDKYEANRKQKIYMRELNQKIAEIEERRSK